MTSKEEIMLAALDRVMRTLRRRPAGKQKLGRGGYRLLKLISEQPNSPTRVIADRLGMRTSSLNERLVKMEAQGVITRERDAADQRVFVVNISAEGEAVLAELRAQRLKMSRVIEGILTEEDIDTLTELADKLSNGLKALGEAPD